MCKKPRYYSDAFKIRVINEVKSGVLTKESARRKYDIKGNSAVLNWMRKFDGIKVERKGVEQSFHSMSQEEEIDRLKAENRFLKEQLKSSSILNEAYDLMIKIMKE